MSKKHASQLQRLLRLTVTASGLLASLFIPSPVWAETFSNLEIDNFYKVTAENVKVDNGYVEMSLPLGGSHLVRVPAERVRCLTNCPADLIQLAQLTTAGSLPANARSFQIHGSNTIGAELMPDLVDEYLTSRQATVNRGGLDTSDPKAPRVDINFETAQGAMGKIEIFSGGSETGFEKLRSKEAAIWMSSRSAKDKEIKEFNDLKLGNLLDAASEHVIALDGLAIVVNPNNPVGVLSLEQIAKIYSGEIQDWAEVEGPSGKIKAFRRSDESGTNSTFKDLVMKPNDRKFGPEVKAVVKNEDLQAEVQRDEAAIGFIGVGFVSHGLKAVAIRTKCGMAYKPDKFSIKTEEYPLSRRLLLYTAGETNNKLADELLDFTLSGKGQQIVSNSGFVELGLGNPEKFESQAGRIANMLAVGASDLASTKRFLDTVRFAERLPLTIRFKKESAEIDNKGQRDLQALADALKNDDFLKRELLLIGFSDDQNPETALKLSEERARIVARTLQQRLNDNPKKSKPVTIYEQNVKWFGSAGPISCNRDDKGAPDEHGRALNRRVEVWIR